MPKRGRMSRREQRERRKRIMEIEAKIRQVCEEMRAIKNWPRGQEPTSEQVNALYDQFDEYQKELAVLVGRPKALDIAVQIYQEVVKST